MLDVGGWHNQFNLATHVLDIMPYQSRRTHEALDPEDGERFSEETWLVYGACAGDWPWPDDYFDFSICSHTLEDVRDPIVITSELARVSKAGYIEVPSWAREILLRTGSGGCGWSPVGRPKLAFRIIAGSANLTTANCTSTRRTQYQSQPQKLYFSIRSGTEETGRERSRYRHLLDRYRCRP